MAELKKHNDIKAAIQIDGEAVITEEASEVFGDITNDNILLYIKSGEKEVKIKISKK